MPDTPENQAAYPQPDTQHPGLGFPLARIAAVFSLACGVVLELGFARYAGKGQGELSLLRQLWDFFQPGDILLADRLMCSWTDIFLLKQRGIDCVMRISKRAVDFRRGQRLGDGDHLVRWRKPGCPRSMDWQTYKSVPESFTVREIRVQVTQRGFRSRTIMVVTTLRNNEAYSKTDLAELYRSRWNNELDLRSLKRTMQMEILRCKTPELVRKEVWTHILAYNLIRTILAQAAYQHDLEPRTISFKAAIQTLEAFQPVLALQEYGSAMLRRRLYDQLLDAIASNASPIAPTDSSPASGSGVPSITVSCGNPER